MTGRRRKYGRVIAVLVFAVALLVAAIRFTPLPDGLYRPLSKAVFDRDGELLRMYPTEDGGGMLRIGVRKKELPEHLIQALLAFEDKRFFYHPGVDPLAMMRAMFLNVKSGRVVSGGSTITMQVARMLERRPRTLKSKFLEMLWAIKLEEHYSKSEILELYFNMAPYGGNIEGVAAASYLYFGKNVSQLSIDEAASLVAIPNQPNRLRPDRNPRALEKRRNDVLAQMKKEDFISTDIFEETRSLSIHARRASIPNLAPHFTHWIRSQTVRSQVHSTINLNLQRQVEKLLQDHLGEFDRGSISNGAIIVLDNESREVLAYVGSQDFHDRSISGQVDGVRALRSPGSTLKPFVYAMAIDRGLIGVNTLLEDVPLRYPDWSPENFDGKFRGIVSARDALISSLNIPAVRLAAKLEPDGLQPLLEQAGLSSFEPNRDYGLSMVLGGCEVRLLELANAYASLASLGMHKPLRFDLNAPAVPAKRVLSAGATYLVSEILTDLTRPELSEVWRETSSIGQFSWKTGTSYGRRDAWSVGYNRRYTVGIWAGNFDGHGAAEIVGSYAAAPLLFRVLNILPAKDTDEWLAQPNSVQTRRVCALSGAPAGPNCTEHRTEFALAHEHAEAPCKVHVAYQVDDETGHRLCSRCRKGRSHHPENHILWPTNVTPWLQKAGIAVLAPPRHNPKCHYSIAGDRPIIHKPLPGDHFVLRDGAPLEHQQIAMLASTEGGTGQVYWFLNGVLVSAVDSGQTAMLDPTTGIHELMAVDAEGRRTAIQINISP